MKITVKTTQQKVFQVDVDPSETVADLKAKIQESQGHPVAVQKIIYSGQILSDGKTVESCGIKEKDFLVLMVAKPKPTPAAPSTAAPPVAVAPSPPVASTVVDPPQSSPPESQPISSSSEPPAFGDPSSFLSGDKLQGAINNMVEMGFPKEEVLRAMRASFNNPDRAVEYLMTGIPSHLEAESPPPPASGQSQPAEAAVSGAEAPQQTSQPQNLFQLAQQQQQGGSGGGPPVGAGVAGAGATGTLNMEALQNTPQIQAIREQIAQNPEMLQPLIQQLANQNPGLAQTFAQNPEALLQLLGVELENDNEGSAPGLPPNAHVISVTEEERAAIQRLEALGFPRQAVLEAYFACDKNEELAANYLFEGGFDS